MGRGRDRPSGVGLYAAPVAAPAWPRSVRHRSAGCSYPTESRHRRVANPHRGRCDNALFLALRRSPERHRYLAHPCEPIACHHR